MDPSEYKITISHEDVEHIMREELKDIIKDHKLEMLHIEKDGGILDEHEDYIYSKRLVHAAAIILGSSVTEFTSSATDLKWISYDWFVYFLLWSMRLWAWVA